MPLPCWASVFCAASLPVCQSHGLLDGLHRDHQPAVPVMDGYDSIENDGRKKEKPKVAGERGARRECHVHALPVASCFHPTSSPALFIKTQFILPTLRQLGLHVHKVLLALSVKTLPIPISRPFSVCSSARLRRSQQRSCFSRAVLPSTQTAHQLTGGDSIRA